MGVATEQDDDSATENESPTQPLGDGGKRALDAERKARRDAERKAADLEARLGELEDRDKSEVARLTDQVAKLTTDLAAAVAGRERWKVALDRGLTATQAKRLVGETAEELAADADELLADLGVKPGGKPSDDTDENESSDDPAPKPTPPSKPRVDLTPGTGRDAPAADTDVSDVSAIGERMFRR